MDPPPRPWHRPLSETLSFSRLLMSGRRQTSGIQNVYKLAAMHCRSDPFVLCRQICLTSVNAASAAVVSVTVSSRLVPGCLGLGFLFCWLSGWRTFTCAASSNLAASAKSVSLSRWRCRECYPAPQYHRTVAGRGSLSRLQELWTTRRRWERSCS